MNLIRKYDVQDDFKALACLFMLHPSLSFQSVVVKLGFPAKFSSRSLGLV